MPWRGPARRPSCPAAAPAARRSGCLRRRPRRGTVADRALLDRVIAVHGATGTVHPAARKPVGESVERPLTYGRENVHGPTALLAAVAAAGVRRSPFSSSAAVRCMPDGEPAAEETPYRPLSPYGGTERAGEWRVRAAGKAHGPGHRVPALLRRGGCRAAGVGRCRCVQRHPDVLRRRPPDARRRLRARPRPRRRPGRRPPAGLVASAGRIGRADRPGAGLGSPVRGTPDGGPGVGGPAPAPPPSAAAARPRTGGEAKGRKKGQVRGDDNGVQCRVARYPPPVVH